MMNSQDIPDQQDINDNDEESRAEGYTILFEEFLEDPWTYPRGDPTGKIIFTLEELPKWIRICTPGPYAPARTKAQLRGWIQAECEKRGIEIPDYFLTDEELAARNAGPGVAEHLQRFGLEGEDTEMMEQ